MSQKLNYYQQNYAWRRLFIRIYVSLKQLIYKCLT